MNPAESQLDKVRKINRVTGRPAKFVIVWRQVMFFLVYVSSAVKPSRSEMTVSSRKAVL